VKDTWKAIGLVLLVVLIGAAIWWFSFGAQIVSSKPIGQGEAIIQKNSSENWLKAQTEFEELYAAIETADRNIVIAHQAYENEDSVFNERNYTGAQMTCQDLIGQYNAKARDYLAADFKAVDLPDQIDTTMPATDCKE